MSSAFFIVLENTDPGFDAMVNGKYLAKEAKRLEKIAKTLGISALEDYISIAPEEARAMMEDFGMDPEEIEKTKLPEQKWFEPQEGLDLIEKYVAHIQANPTAVKNAKGVLADFTEYKEVFTKAKAIKTRWNLQVDF